MRKTILAVLTTLLLIAGFVSGASAAPPEDRRPGPNGKNNHGLCTAYFNGKKKGHDKHGSPPPFAGLEEEASEHDQGNGSNDEDLETEQQISDDVFEYCDQFGIGGNPEHNGRYDCREGEGRDDPARDTDDDAEIECVANGTESD